MFTFLVLPFWCRLTQVVSDKIQRAIKWAGFDRLLGGNFHADLATPMAQSLKWWSSLVAAT